MATAVTRAAGPSDADVVGRLLQDFNDEFDTAGPDAQTFARRFRPLLERDDVLVLLAEDGADHREAVGLAFLTLRPTPYYDGLLAQLEELYVRPGLRDQGIGTALLLESIRIASARGTCEVHINVDEVDTDTRRFYERHGFTNIQPGADYRMLCYLREL